MLRTVLIALLLSLAPPLSAAVLESGEHGFTVSHSLETVAEPAVVYRTMTARIGEWWGRVTFTYRVFGHPPGGLLGIAPAVDGVIGEQLQQLGERLTRE